MKLKKLLITIAIFTFGAFLGLYVTPQNLEATDGCDRTVCKLSDNKCVTATIAYECSGETRCYSHDKCGKGG